MLSRRQARLLRILEEASDHGRRMSYQALLQPMGALSRSNIQRVVLSLIERGFLAWSSAPRRLTVIRRLSSITVGEPASDDPVVLFIHEHQRASDGVSPSVREIRERFGFTFNGVQSRMIELERAGAIVRKNGGEETGRRGARFIYVVKKDRDDKNEEGIAT